jgi:1-acyl-sn-glycerol-3-phosphate acyltransferase
MVFVDRGDSDAARKSIEQVAEVLRSGACLVAFPEGTRSRSGEIGAFKTGAFVAAIKAGVPVVPVKIEGSAAVLPPDGFSPRPGRVGLIVGPAINSSGLTLEDRRALADKTQIRLAALSSGRV